MILPLWSSFTGPPSFCCKEEACCNAQTRRLYFAMVGNRPCYFSVSFLWPAANSSRDPQPRKKRNHSLRKFNGPVIYSPATRELARYGPIRR